ncbi:acetyl-CoA carboxylase carboxyltransferase subunit alpha [candidate division FCPU426 bacterium]|nr:acetyl-CoA carboxylase carboxyltransferase subunit alpha [candidate division FCPU426 bacterium]
MAHENLDFEESLVELERRIDELKKFSDNQRLDMQEEIKRMEERAQKLRRETYEQLTPWQIVQISRHLQRPHTLDYIHGMFEDFMEMHGDRAFIDDRAMVGGVAWLNKKPLIVIGTQKGKDTKENIACNFGLPLPEGYRKALRLMKFAEKFNLPVVTLVDTAGAFPGLEGEERGVAEAIARNLREMSILRIPVVVVIIGEGGSGGALGIGVGNRVLMLANASYTVITPEGCAAILWKDRNQAPRASEILRLTAPDLKQLGIIDEIIGEPPGGAHHEPAFVIEGVKQALERHLGELSKKSVKQLQDERYEKFRRIGFYTDADLPKPCSSPPANEDTAPAGGNGKPDKKKKHD